MKRVYIAAAQDMYSKVGQLQAQLRQFAAKGGGTLQIRKENPGAVALLFAKTGFLLSFQLIEQLEQLLLVNRLEQVVYRRITKRLTGVLEISESAHNNAPDIRLNGFQLLDELQSVNKRHANICNNYIYILVC
ncbi:hypothetical protein D3C77_227730 [compost metagenome]